MSTRKWLMYNAVEVVALAGLWILADIHGALQFFVFGLCTLVVGLANYAEGYEKAQHTYGNKYSEGEY